MTVKCNSFLQSRPRIFRFTGFVFAACLAFFIICNIALATEIKILAVSDLEEDGRRAQDIHAVIILYFAASECRYCMRLEEAVLEPMLRSTHYDSQVILRKVDWRSSSMAVGFSGQNISLHSLSEHYAVKVTPTLVFVDSEGRELAPRILGFKSADFFWYYLDRRIHKSRAGEVLRP